MRNKYRIWTNKGQNTKVKYIGVIYLSSEHANELRNAYKEAGWKYRVKKV